MIDLVLLVAVAVLLVNAAAGILRALVGPSAADRLLAIQLLATTGIAVLLLLAEATHQPAARLVALVLAILAAAAALAFVRRLWWRLGPGEEGGP